MIFLVLFQQGSDIGGLLIVLGVGGYPVPVGRVAARSSSSS